MPGLLVVELPDGSSASVDGPAAFGRGQPPCLADSFLSRQHMLLTPLESQADGLMLTNQGQNGEGMNSTRVVSPLGQSDAELFIPHPVAGAAIIVQQQEPNSSSWKTAAILQPGQQQQVGAGSRFFLPSREATTTLTIRSNSNSSSGGGQPH